jgi:ubiquinone/menaquinone biosynthesis C-methylase UbiE
VSENIKVRYTDISKTYDKYRMYSEDEIREIIDFAEIRQGMKILDLGCGTGNVASGLLKYIYVDVIGLDISLPMLTVARDKSLEVLCADAGSGRLPFLDSSFDAIVGGFVIHQIGNLESLFPECHRILRSGGITFLTSSHRQIEYQHPVIKQFFPSLIDIDTARFPDIPEVASLLYQAGFTGIKHRETGVRKIPLDNTYLKKVKGKFISTFQLVPQPEFEAGVAKLEEFISNLRQPEFREWRGTLMYGEKVRG